MDISIYYTPYSVLGTRNRNLKRFDFFDHQSYPFTTICHYHAIYIIYIETDIVFFLCYLANCLAGNTNLQSIHRRPCLLIFIILATISGLGADVQGQRWVPFSSLCYERLV